MTEPSRLWILDDDTGTAARAEPLTLLTVGRRWALAAIAVAALGAALALWGLLAGLMRWLLMLALVTSLVLAARSWAALITAVEEIDHDEHGHHHRAGR